MKSYPKAEIVSNRCWSVIMKIIFGRSCVIGHPKEFNGGLGNGLDCIGFHHNAEMFFSKVVRAREPIEEKETE